MKKLRLFFILIVAGGLIFAMIDHFSPKQHPKSNAPILEVDFDKAMGKGSSSYRSISLSKEDRGRYDIIKTTFYKNSPSIVPKQETAKIPKRIHQIWLGPKVPPEYFYRFRDKMRTMHPDWEYYLWTDSNIQELHLDLQDLVDESTNFAEKSDIIRSCILERFGGVYMDVDVEPLKCMDELHHKYDFYAGMEEPHKIATTSSHLWLGISIIAAAPGHPIIKRWKELIRKRWEPVNIKYSSQIERIINHTYFPFSMAFFEKYASHSDKYTNIVFPTTYFYPLTPVNAARRRSPLRAIREKIFDVLEAAHIKKARAFSSIQPETIAVHYWGSNWQPNHGEQMRDLQNQLDFLSKELYHLKSQVRNISNNIPSTESEDILHAIDQAKEVIPRSKN